MPGSQQRSITKRVTIKDVAQAAGVSITTVSNVLNDRTNAMSEETLQRVINIMRDLDYRPSALARGLVTQRTATVGVIVAEIETPLFLQAFNTIDPVARDAGYNVLMSNARNAKDEHQVLKLLLEKQVDGIIFLSVSEYVDDDHLLELQRLKIPAVLINRATIHDCFDHINWDDTAGVVVAVEHLARLGHRRTAHLCGPQNRRSGANRLEGYRLGLEQHGIEYRQEYTRPGDYTADPETWRQSTFELLDLSPRPTAIIASDDVVAAIATRTIQKAGLRVPQDIAVVGIDDQHFCPYLNPALTTVRLPILDAGERAIEMLLERIAGRRTEVEHVTLPCSLIVRESCGAGNAKRDK